MNGRPHFALFGIPVRVEPVFFLVTAYLALGERQIGLMIAWVAVVFVSILLHELGHALAYRRFGSPASIVLWGLGGLTMGRSQAPRRSIAVSLAGPLAGLAVLGLPALWLQQQEVVTDPSAAAVLDMVVWVNVAWSVVNLLPVLPLDGGNVARDVLTLVTRRPGERPARLVSVATAAGAGLWAWQRWPGWWFPVVMAGILVALNLSALQRGASDRSHIHVTPAPRRDRRTRSTTPGGPSPRSAPGDVSRLLLEGHRALDAGNTVGAHQAAAAVLALKPYPDVARMACELHAWAHLADDDLAGARAAVAAIPGGRKANRYLRAIMRASDPTDDAGLAEVVGAFLFAGDGVDRVRAADQVAQRDFTVTVADGLLAAGSDGLHQVMQLERTLQERGRLAAAGEVRARLLGA